MRKSRFTEAQIIGMIKEQEAGMPTAEVCRSTWQSTLSNTSRSPTRLILVSKVLGIFRDRQIVWSFI